VGLGDEGTRLSVPTSALSVRDGKASVFVAVQDNGRLVARQVAVQTGGHANDRTEIVSGLKSGVDVITLGQDRLRDGDPITVTPAGAQAPPAASSNAEQPTHAGHGE
jgi:multidrug efflux pump subunit AcrA (membrane-fusion protein)